MPYVKERLAFTGILVNGKNGKYSENNPCL